MPDDELTSLFARKFKIPSINTDPVRWNKEWEKHLPKLSFSEDVYPVFRKIWEGDEPEWPLAERAQDIKNCVHGLQETLVKLWTQMEGGHFVLAWLLLEEDERKRHLFNGFKNACKHASFGEDLRAMCPEITQSHMLERKGKEFIDYIKEYTKGIQGVDPGTVYTHPSEWWQKAVDVDVDVEPSSKEAESAFTLLTIQRNEFISRFLIDATMSVLHDLSYGSPGMDPVKKILKADSMFAHGWAEVKSGMRDKPIIRCENCTKSPEEIGPNVKFMLCSSCKAKLNFTVHYCSQACQKEDWRNHKKHCGKEKVSKKLKGTVNDRFWAFPALPDHLRSADLPAGNVPITAMGFGTPHPSHPHSPALQRQVSLITGDKVVDYFLFDDTDRPIPFVASDMWTKMAFRLLRSDAMFSAEQKGIEALAEYLIKYMGQKPGLSRQRILDQFNREYGDDTAAKVVEFERKAVENGYEPGTTFLETMSSGLTSAAPQLMAMR